MKRIVAWLTLCMAATGYLFGQQSAQQLRAPSPSPIRIEIGASWYHPKLDGFNSAFASLEDQLGLQRWSGDRIDYSVDAGVRYRLFDDQDAVLEGGVTGVYRSRADDRAFNSLWRLGAGYRIATPVISPLELSGQATVGVLQASFSRSYDSKALMISAAKTSWYATVGAGVGYALLSRTSLQLNLRYLYAPKLTVAAPAATLDLKALTIGLGVVLQLPS